MAIPLGVISSSLPGETTLLVKYPTLRLAPVNLRTVRPMTLAAASKSVNETKKREPRGIMKPRRVSPDMQAFLGSVSDIPRTQVLKEIWAYIKEHDLQDSADKKVINCDENLKKILGGRDRVGFLEIAGLISPHFLK